MAKSEEPATVEAPTGDEPAKSRTNRPLVIGGIVAGSVLAAGLVFGGGVLVGSHLPHVGAPGFPQGQLQGPPGGFQPGGPQGGPQGGPRDDRRDGGSNRGGDRPQPDEQRGEPGDGSTETPSN